MKFVVTIDDIICYGLLALSVLILVISAIKWKIVRLVGKIRNRRNNNEERGHQEG